MTIAELAELAGVSKTTASFIIGGRAEEFRISEATRDRVLALAEQHQFRPNLNARALRGRRVLTFGLVVPDLTNYGFAVTTRELEKLCRNAGCQLLITCSEDDVEKEQEVVSALLERQIDGLIVASAMTDDSFYQQLGCPVVQLDRQIGDSDLPLVMTDSVSITANLVARIGRECSELAYIGGLEALSSERQRYQGYCQGLLRNSRSPEVTLVSRGDFTRESGYRQLAELHKRLGRLPGGIFCASFTLLEGVLRYFKEHQLLTAHCQLSTFDDHELLNCMPFAVDSIEQDCGAMAEGCFQQLQCLIEEESYSAVTVLLPGRIHWRSSQVL